MLAQIFNGKKLKSWDAEQREQKISIEASRAARAKDLNRCRAARATYTVAMRVLWFYGHGLTPHGCILFLKSW